jgi:hypothetical protein
MSACIALLSPFEETDDVGKLADGKYSAFRHDGFFVGASLNRNEGAVTDSRHNSGGWTAGQPQQRETFGPLKSSLSPLLFHPHRDG